MRRAYLLLLLSLIVATGAFAQAAMAGPLVGMAADNVLLPGGPAADRAVAAWAANGVDVVRIMVRWDGVSVKPGARRRPAGTVYDFWRIDAAVDRVRAAGMEPILTLTGPGPLWGMSNTRIHNRHLRPSPRAYADFAAQAAQHFLGRVHTYILWNEPNLGHWLEPQQHCTRRSCTPTSPDIYRGLVNAAGPAVHGVDPSAKLLLGALAPRAAGARRSGVSSGLAPLVFLRALGCVDARYRPIRSGGCRHFKAASGSALAVHPYSGTLPPGAAYPSADDVDLASLPHMERVLDKLRRANRLRVGPGLWLDEYGFQTRPPDPFLGVTLSQQDSWLQEAAYRAWRDPRVQLFGQYVWIDERSVFSGWQSGLLFKNGRPKPALRHFPVPFFLDAGRSLAWGQVRPGGAHTVIVQRRARGQRNWGAIARVQTDARGYWTRRVGIVRGASYRFVTADGSVPASGTRVAR